MKSPLFLTALLLASASSAIVDASAFTTEGHDTKYTLPMLADLADSGVQAQGEGVFALTADLTVSASDSFSIEGVQSLLMGDGVTLTIEGYADFDAGDDRRVLITRQSESAEPRGIDMCYASVTDDKVTFRNIDFEYVGLRNSTEHGFDVADCTFRYANGKLTGTGALSVGCSDAEFSITGCTFEQNTIPAIGGAANYACGLYIADCVFVNNNTANTNKPQLNLTVGGDLPVTITRCTITGAGLNMVGGIAVGNLLTMPGSNRVYISDCVITEHRYGLTGIGRMSMFIADNTFINNNHETNAMNGGSGISLAGYGYGLNAVIAGNHIENSLWGITLISCDNVSLGEIDNPDSPGNNVFVNNGNGGKPYDLYNNQINEVFAQNNTWSVPEQTEALIETVIYHAADDSRLGRVIFMPAHEQDGINSPIDMVHITIEDGCIKCRDAVNIYDAMGRIVCAESMNPSIATLAPGLYVARSGNRALKFITGSK